MKIQDINILSEKEIFDKMNEVIYSNLLKIDFQHRMHDDSIRDVEVFSNKIEIGENIFLYSIIQDVTERKQSEKLLKEKNELINAFLYNAPIYCYIKEITTTQSIVLHASNNFKTLVGISGNDLIGKTMEEIFDPDTALRITKDDLAVISSNKVFKVEEEYKGKTYSTVKYPIGKNILAGYTIDVTEHKLIEHQFMQLQKSDCLKTMAGAIAHNFNNHLHVVIGNLEIALMTSHVNKIQNLLTSAIRASQKAAEISKMMLIYTSQVDTKLEILDLYEVCFQSVEFIKEIPSNNATINIKLLSNKPFIYADRSQINHILIALITNACESSSTNRVDIFVELRIVTSEEIPKIRRFPIDWEHQNISYACIEIKDNGSGILDEYMHKIFDPFFTTKFIGRGMGLPTVLGLLKLYKGAITVESKYNVGSIFRVFIPLYENTVFTEANKKVKKNIEKNVNKTILLIDDNEDILKASSTMLKYLNYTVLTAKSGIEALELFKDHLKEINLVITDLSMPDINGWDVIKSLRKMSSTVLIILSSGYDKETMSDKHFSESPDAYLLKPYSLKTFKDTISKLIG